MKIDMSAYDGDIRLVQALQARIIEDYFETLTKVVKIFGENWQIAPSEYRKVKEFKKGIYGLLKENKKNKEFIISFFGNDYYAHLVEKVVLERKEGKT